MTFNWEILLKGKMLVSNIRHILLNEWYSYNWTITCRNEIVGCSFSANGELPLNQLSDITTSKNIRHNDWAEEIKWYSIGVSISLASLLPQHRPRDKEAPFLGRTAPLQLRITSPDVTRSSRWPINITAWRKTNAVHLIRGILEMKVVRAHPFIYEILLLKRNCASNNRGWRE